MQKVEYMGEFAEWMFTNEYDASEAVDQLLHAVNVLLGTPSAIPPRLSSISITKHNESILDDVKDIKTMDVLVRLYVMIASIVGRDQNLFRQCNLSAAFIVENMFKRALVNVEAAVKAGVNPGEYPKPKSREKKSSSPDHLKLLDGSPSKHSRKSATSRGSKASSRVPYPTNIEAWTSFALKPTYQEHFKADTCGAYLSAVSITKPELSLFYLEALSENLCSLGFHHEAIVSTLLMSIITNDILENKNATTLVHMKMCDLYAKLKLKVRVRVFHHHNNLRNEELANVGIIRLYQCF